MTINHLEVSLMMITIMIAAVSRSLEIRRVRTDVRSTEITRTTEMSKKHPKD